MLVRLAFPNKGNLLILLTYLILGFCRTKRNKQSIRLQRRSSWPICCVMRSRAVFTA